MVGEGETTALRGPLTLDGLRAFADWLRCSGVHMGTLQGCHVLRYMAWKGRVGLVSLEDGVLRPNSVAKGHLDIFRRGHPRLARPITTAENIARRRERLLARDGTDCCICGRELGDDVSIEHWVAQYHDGSEDDANLGLAHATCNNIVASLSVSEKLRVRDVLADWLERHLPHHMPFDPAILPAKSAIHAWARVRRFNQEEEDNGQVQRNGMLETSDASSAGAREI